MSANQVVGAGVADNVSVLIGNLQKVLEKYGDLPVELTSSYVTPEDEYWKTYGIIGEEFAWMDGSSVGLTIQQGKLMVHDGNV